MTNVYRVTHDTALQYIFHVQLKPNICAFRGLNPDITNVTSYDICLSLTFYVKLKVHPSITILSQTQTFLASLRYKVLNDIHNSK